MFLAFQRPVRMRPIRKLSALTVIERITRMMPSASARLKSPLLVSNAMAVVIVRGIAAHIAADDDDRADFGDRPAECGEKRGQ